jgi:hypothetical protein
MSEFKFQVALWEYERGWGSKLDEVKSFDTYEEAELYRMAFNAQNDEDEVPDWYMIAERHNYKQTENITNGY